MVFNYLKKGLFLLIVFSFVVISVLAQSQDRIEGIWYNAEQTAKIQLYKATDGLYYGKIVWLKIPLLDGKPKTDIHNPDKNRRNDPEMGLVILRHLKKINETSYDDGSIYDPKNGKTYTCKITPKGNTLDLRGYMGISLLGRTTIWTKATY